METKLFPWAGDPGKYTAFYIHKGRFSKSKFALIGVYGTTETAVAEFSSAKAAKAFAESLGKPVLGKEPDHPVCPVALRTQNFSSRFGSWFTGTVLCTTGWPVHGRHQLTPHQIKQAPGEYKNRLFKNIRKAIENGDITETHLKKYS